MGRAVHKTEVNKAWDELVKNNLIPAEWDIHIVATIINQNVDRVMEIIESCNLDDLPIEDEEGSDSLITVRDAVAVAVEGAMIAYRKQKPTDRKRRGKKMTDADRLRIGLWFIKEVGGIEDATRILKAASAAHEVLNV